MYTARIGRELIKTPAIPVIDARRKSEEQSVSKTRADASVMRSTGAAGYATREQ